MARSLHLAGVRWRLVALPVEHGGWGFVGEPTLLGLLVAPSWAGLTLGIAALATFLIAQPLGILALDRRRGKWSPRTTAALLVGCGYATIALGGFVGALVLARQAFWQPLLVAIPLALVQVVLRVRNQGRTLAAELCGALALGAIAAMIALAAGREPRVAWALWAVLAARALTAIPYVRILLRRGRGQQVAGAPVLAAHAAVLAVGLVAALVGLLPWLATVALGILLARAIGGWRSQGAVPAKIIGMREVGFGALTVALVAAGYAFQR